METVWIEMVLIAVAIVANGFFSGSEIALVSARPSRLAQLHGERAPGAERALALKRDPDTFLATVQIAITLVGTLASAVGGATAVEALRPWIAELLDPGVARWAEAIALGAVILLITFVSLVIGELTPKALALRNPERAACLVAPVIHRISRLAAGPNRLLTLSTRAVLTVLGQREAGQPPPVSEEEVKYLVREGATHLSAAWTSPPRPTSSCARRRSRSGAGYPSFADPSTRWWASSPSRTSSALSRAAVSPPWSTSSARRCSFRP